MVKKDEVFRVATEDDGTKISEEAKTAEAYPEARLVKRNILTYWFKSQSLIGLYRLDNSINTLKTLEAVLVSLYSVVYADLNDYEEKELSLLSKRAKSITVDTDDMMTVMDFLGQPITCVKYHLLYDCYCVLSKAIKRIGISKLEVEPKDEKL